MTRAPRGAAAPPAGRVLPLEVTIHRDEVVRLLGYPPAHALPPRIVALLDETLSAARRLVCARGAFVRLPPERAAEVGLRRRAAAALVVGLVTAGDAIDASVADASRRGELTRALLLDAAGSAAAEEAADRLGAVAVGAATADPAALPCRFSPGYGSWALADQARLLALLPRVALGVTLLPSLMMVPSKSVSFAMWLGAAPTRAASRGCARCSLDRCQYRRRAPPRTRP